MVAKHEGTVAFIEASDYLNERKGVTYLDIEEKLELPKRAISNMKIGKRKAKKHEIRQLINTYSEIQHFFNNPALSQTLEEPMERYQNGGSATLRALVETQRKLIERIEAENKAMKEKQDQLEGENKALREVLGKRKS